MTQESIERRDGRPAHPAAGARRWPSVSRCGGLRSLRTPLTVVTSVGRRSGAATSKLAPATPVRGEHLVGLARRRAQTCRGRRCRADRRRRSRLCSRRASSTSASRRRPAGPASAARYRRVTPWRWTRSARAVTGSSWRTTSRPSSCSSRSARQPARNQRRLAPAAVPAAIVDDEQRNDLVALVERPPQRRGCRRVAGHAGTRRSRRSRIRRRHQSSRREDELLDVEQAGTEAGLAAGQVEVPHPPEHVVEAERSDVVARHRRSAVARSPACRRSRGRSAMRSTIRSRVVSTEAPLDRLDRRDRDRRGRCTC